MSDNDGKTRKRRAPIDALKVLNFLRGEKGLPKVRANAPGKNTPPLNREQRNKLAVEIWAELYPAAVTQNDYVLPSGAEAAVLKEFVRRAR
jgi:hypothetical protein